MSRIIGLIPEPELQLSCPHCGKEYKSEQALEKHIKEKHKDDEA